MTKIGEKLRAVRNEKGITLQQISDETKISPRYLEAVENGDAANLPGAVFARNFTRQYANYLGVGGLGMKAGELEELIRGTFPTEAEIAAAASGRTITNTPATASAEPIQVAPISDSWNWQRIGVSALALVVVLAAGAGVFRVWQSAPAVLQSAREEAGREAAAGDAAKAVIPAVATSRQAVVPSVKVDSQTTQSPTGEPISETTITISAGGMAVRLVAEQDTWVSMSANGSHVFSELIKANQSRTISGVENARIKIGNAGGLKIATNGKDIGPIGLPGQVREVQLTPEGAKISPPAI